METSRPCSSPGPGLETTGIESTVRSEGAPATCHTTCDHAAFRWSKPNHACRRRSLAASAAASILAASSPVAARSHCAMVNRCCGISSELPVGASSAPRLASGAAYSLARGLGWGGGVEDSEGESQGRLWKEPENSPSPPSLSLPPSCHPRGEATRRHGPSP
ncbi:hypothetical protein ANANG_G00042040 [Anguilla anguilla]|uniref:Uncharacterized protein n=1 Tax=Anguilla anguilla TaxID=7936 RepID=A0A9D3S4R8_ANGAN|nr:hypothetical protein ANANG_G00042040 [Anguilla anguilla]